MAQKVKLSTIAEALGLSTATVSLALRDSPLVAESTRERIKEEARASGYIYNRRAASLRTSKSGIIGVCVSDIMNPFFGEILKAIENELDRHRQTFVLCNHYDQLSKQRAFVDTMLQLGADGLIMSPAIGTPAPDIHLAEQNDLPVTLIARTVEGCGVTSFSGDDSYGMRLAVNHLIGKGYRRIAMVGGTDLTSTGRERERGYREALAEAMARCDVLVPTVTDTIDAALIAGAGGQHHSGVFRSRCPVVRSRRGVGRRGHGRHSRPAGRDRASDGQVSIRIPD